MSRKKYFQKVKERAEQRQRFIQGLLQFLKVKYPRQNVHVWLNSDVYLGFYIWGFAFHWKWGASDISPKRVHELTKGAQIVNLQYCPVVV